jgi:hydrogenase maturation protease
MNGTLIIGFGNTLRSDDGAGVRAAEKLAERLPGADVVTLHGLQPEIAEMIARYDTLVFIDAAIDAAEVTVTPVRSDLRTQPRSSHGFSPGEILALSHSLYGRRPRRVLLATIPATTFAFGEQVSHAMRERFDNCVERIVRELEHSPAASSAPSASGTQ